MHDKILRNTSSHCVLISTQYSGSNRAFGKCLGHCCSSKGVIPSSAVKTIVVLSCLHGSLCEYDHTPLHVVLLVLPEDSQAQNYIFNVFNSLATIFAGVSLLTLTAISVDRLLALQMGLRYRQVVTLRRAWILVAVFWIFSITIAMTFFFNFRITIFIISIATFFCIVTSTLCYTKIYLTLRNHQAQVQDTVHQGQANRGGTSLNIERYKKTVSSALWLQITLAVCYLPYTIVAIIFAIAETHTQLLGLCLEAALTLVLFNSSLNPFLYCWKMKEVRQVVKVMVRNFSCFSCQL